MHIQTELTKSLGWMTITEGLMTPAPSLEIAAALLAVHQKGNNSSQASLSGTNFKENGFDIQSKASAPESGKYHFIFFAYCGLTDDL